MKKRKIIILLSCLVCAQAVGSLSVTLAWYQYAASTKLNYSGCTVNKTDSVQVGIRSDVKLDDAKATELGLIFDHFASNLYVYWPATDLNSAQIQYVMEANGYAYNVLQATTSSTFHSGDAFKLHDSPKECSNYNLLYDAKKSAYVQLNLVFKTGSGGSSHIYLDDFSFVNTGNLYESFRIYIKSNTLSAIYNPSKNLDGSTEVGGKLDLNNDEIWDYFDSTSKNYNFFYGTYSGSLNYNSTPSVTGTLAPSNPGDYNVFTGDTFNGYYEWDESAINIEKADYLGRASVMNGSQSLCDIDGFGYAYVDMTCYLEGWDHNLIDANSTNMFDAKFTFVS